MKKEVAGYCFLFIFFLLFKLTIEHCKRTKKKISKWEKAMGRRVKFLLLKAKKNNKKIL
jgi:hypothetical protein